MKHVIKFVSCFDEKKAKQIFSEKEAYIRGRFEHIQKLPVKKRCKLLSELMRGIWREKYFGNFTDSELAQGVYYFLSNNIGYYDRLKYWYLVEAKKHLHPDSYSPHLKNEKEVMRMCLNDIYYRLGIKWCE
jgi:hypothetical protein